MYTASASIGAGFVCGHRAYVKDHHIAAGAVVSGVGCVSRWRLRDATGVRVRSGEEDVEIVSLMGTVSEHGCHLHASFSRADLSAFGGHLLPGMRGEHHGGDRAGGDPGPAFTRSRTARPAMRSW